MQGKDRPAVGAGPTDKRRRRVRNLEDEASQKNSIGLLKSRIRSLERLLSNVQELPAGVKTEKRRELESLQHELDRALRDKHRSKMIQKYHMVRFFGRFPQRF